jgi:integrase/recombinase XerC
MHEEPLLPLHLEYLQMRNHRPRSIRERRLAVMRTRRRLVGPLSEATVETLKTWQHTIAHLTPAGQHNEIVHTVQYLKWVIKDGYRADDPTNVIVRPRNVGQQLPRPMSDADIGRALLAAEHPVRAWIALAAFCGLRCMEIASLTRTNVRDNQVPAVLDITGKGGKNRIVPLPARVLAELYAAGMPNRGYLWARMDGGAGPPTAGRVSERINKHLHAQGIPDTAHALRHRFGTILYRATHDPFLVARVMGHASTDTTKGYVLVDPFDAAPHIEQISRLTGEA